MSLLGCHSYLKSALLQQGANAVAAQSMGDPNQPLGKLVKIMNNQLQALSHLDARTDDLSTKVEALTSGESECLIPICV